MSQARVDAVRGMYAASAKGDVPTIIATLDPEVEWWEAENFIYADENPYVGRNAVLEGVFMRIGGEWERFTVAPEEVLDAGDTVIGYGYYSGTFKKTGKHVRAHSHISSPSAMTRLLSFNSTLTRLSFSEW